MGKRTVVQVGVELSAKSGVLAGKSDERRMSEMVGNKGFGRLGGKRKREWIFGVSGRGGKGGLLAMEKGGMGRAQSLARESSAGAAGSGVGKRG